MTARPDTPVVGVIGVGATGARAARQVAGADEIGSVVLQGSGASTGSSTSARVDALQRSLGDRASVGDPFDHDLSVLVLAALLFNLVSDLTGGIRMTVIDEDLIVAPARRPTAPPRSDAPR